MVLRYILFSPCLYLSWTTIWFLTPPYPLAMLHSWLARELVHIYHIHNASGIVSKLAIFLACDPATERHNGAAITDSHSRSLTALTGGSANT